MKTGDILTYKWGYDQTNTEFFQVVKTTAKTATIREIKTIKTEKDMIGKCFPVKDSFKGEAKRKKIQLWNDDKYLNMDYGVAKPWNGKAQEFTTYA